MSATDGDHGGTRRRQRRGGVKGPLVGRENLITYVNISGVKPAVFLEVFADRPGDFIEGRADGIRSSFGSGTTSIE